VSVALPEAEDMPYRLKALWAVEGKGRAWLDFANDVTTKDVKLAAQEGFRSVEHMKRYTTQGMAPDQGNSSNVPALAVRAEFLIGEGLADRQDGQLRLAKDLLPALRNRELAAVASQHAPRSGMTYRHVPDGQPGTGVSGRKTGHALLNQRPCHGRGGRQVEQDGGARNLGHRSTKPRSPPFGGLRGERELVGWRSSSYSPSSGCEVVTVFTVSQLTWTSDSFALSQTTSLPGPHRMTSRTPSSASRRSAS